MFIVTVEFVVRPQYVEAFYRAMRDQAHNSLNREPDCHQFDVCVDPQDRGKVLLYEVYADDAAFQFHLKTDHYQDFDTTVRGWVESKTVQFWNRLSS